MSGQHALMSVGFLECFVQGKRMSIYVVALLALARAGTKKIGIPGFGGRFLDDHPKFVPILFFGGRLVSQFFWWTFFGGRLVSHFFWWTQFKLPFLTE